MTTKAEQIEAVGAQYCLTQSGLKIAMVLPCGNMQIMVPAKLSVADAILLKQWIIANYETSV
jgi:hypothetical protein